MRYVSELPSLDLLSVAIQNYLVLSVYFVVVNCGPRIWLLEGAVWHLVTQHCPTMFTVNIILSFEMQWNYEHNKTQQIKGKLY